MRVVPSILEHTQICTINGIPLKRTLTDFCTVRLHQKWMWVIVYVLETIARTQNIEHIANGWQLTLLTLTANCGNFHAIKNSTTLNKLLWLMQL